MKRMLLAAVATGLLAGCGVLGGKDKPTTPTVGQRIAVLSGESGVEVDPALGPIAVTLPAVLSNVDWPQPGGNADKSLGHVALPAQLTRAWSVSIGQGTTKRVRLAAAPSIADGRIYVVDTTATVRAFDAATGARIWERPIGSAEERRGGTDFFWGELTGNAGVLFGGGASFEGGRVYATSGLGDVATFDAATGEPGWSVRVGGPLRGAPTLAQDSVYVMTQDNRIFSLARADGKAQWDSASTVELAGVFGMAAPAAAAGTVVAGFSSGELTAYRYENGRTLWQDALSRTTISTAVASLSDIDAEPVIDNGRVYAIGQGGRMVALELNTGQRIWEVNLAGISTPWVAGEWIFVVTDQAKLYAVARSSGKIKWMTQLPRYRDEEDKKGMIDWKGPILAGDRLLLINSRGTLTSVSPYDGTIQSSLETGYSVSLTPVVANGVLYILNDAGQLSAWR